MTYFEKRPGDKSTRLHHSSFNIFQSCWSIRLHCAFNWLEKYSDYYRYRYNPRNCLWVIYGATKSQRYAPVAECKRWPKKKKNGRSVQLISLLLLRRSKQLPYCRLARTTSTFLNFLLTISSLTTLVSSPYDVSNNKPTRTVARSTIKG